MCSRYCLISPPDAVRSMFGYQAAAAFPPRYNIAPTQPVAIVRHDHHRRRDLALVRWGLLPPWVKDPGAFATLVNARAETAAEKPSFRGALRHRRCLIPADGYYEWTGDRGARRPHLVRSRAGQPLAMAGLWEHWLGADGSEIETMAILTVAPGPDVAPIHDRMPALIAPEWFEAWLDTRSGTSRHILDLLCPAAEGTLEVVEVSPLIGNPRHDGPEVLGEMARKNI